jgi:hypothetical protein
MRTGNVGRIASNPEKCGRPHSTPLTDKETQMAAVAPRWLPVDGALSPLEPVGQDVASVPHIASGRSAMMVPSRAFGPWGRPSRVGAAPGGSMPSRTPCPGARGAGRPLPARPHPLPDTGTTWPSPGRRPPRPRSTSPPAGGGVFSPRPRAEDQTSAPSAAPCVGTRRCRVLPAAPRHWPLTKGG